MTITTKISPEPLLYANVKFYISHRNQTRQELLLLPFSDEKIETQKC